MHPALPAINALTAHIALLDPDRTIVAVNTAWSHFARANGADEQTATGVGLNYLAVCRATVGDTASDASAVATGITEVLVGRSDTFTWEYPCHAPHERRWFRMRVNSLGPDAGVILVHESVTADRCNAESNAWLAAIVASSNDAFTRWLWSESARTSPSARPMKQPCAAPIANSHRLLNPGG